MDALHHLDDIHAPEPGAQVADLVRERDERRQHGIRGVLDHLGRLVVGSKGRDVPERRVRARQGGNGPLVHATDHDAIGLHEIPHRHAFGEELGVHSDTEVDAGAPTGRLLEQRAHNVVGRAGHHRALDDHHVVTTQVAERGADVAGGLPHVPEIDALAVERGTDRDESHLAGAHGGGQVAGGAQPRADVPTQQRLEAVFVDRRLAAVDAIDLVLIDVDAGDVVPHLRKAGTRHQAHVAGADDGELHQASSASRW